jgi:hypothetical protein
MALDAIDISTAKAAAQATERLAAYVMAEYRTGRPAGAGGPARLTECEAFLLRSGRKALALEGLRW